MVLRQYMFYSLPPRRSLVIPALVYTFALVHTYALVSHPRAILASVLASVLVSRPRAILASVRRKDSINGVQPSLKAY